MALGIIGGTSLFETELLKGGERVVTTAYGAVFIRATTIRGIELFFIPRHGRDRNIPPQQINFRANLQAFRALGVEEIIGVTSVGSLKREIPPHSFIVPHDYISLFSIPTYFDTELVHVTPGLDERLRQRLIAAARALGFPVIARGVYFQVQGPRLETRAEINLIKEYADVVGMSMASEATLAIELGLRYANISTVDNYAHGIIEEPLEYRDIIESAARSREDLERVLLTVIEGMSE
jgi:5'-methylthioadenosine phosphorylase